MALRPTSGPRCLKHQIECTFNCGWCGKSICEECVTFAHGKKFCDKCWTKKSQLGGASPAREESSTPRPRVPIRNVDTSLDPKIAEQKRIELPNKKKVDPSIFEL
ncbi:MAG TPA: hypothetical protein VEC16_02115 [Alphaproteobacteria bacterium]|nr:hypothetical protein [Alphaproteobacteria bacterium]